jgi:hypothetical protein
MNQSRRFGRPAKMDVEVSLRSFMSLKRLVPKL